jgi:hypothetical protein
MQPPEWPWLSPTACAWLVARGVQPVSRAPLATTDPLLLAIHRRYGALSGIDPIDGRELWIASANGFGATRTIDERTHWLIGGYSPIAWWMDDAGVVVEIDDLGQRFYESDTLEHRIEQLALFDHGPEVERLDGCHGERIAKALGLEPIDHATDSRQRYWMRFELLVRESLEPSEYGQRDLVERTWVSGPTREAVRAAIERR